MRADSAAALLETMHPPACVDVDARRGQTFAPAVVCWHCEESIDLTATAAELAAFVREHAHAEANTDPTIR